MKAFTTAFASLVLSLLLMGSALATEKVNINTADSDTIARVLTNVGPSKAEEIVAHRSANGPFRSADELALVRGIGLRTVELNRDRIELGASAQRRPMPAGSSVGSTGAGGQQR